jgi:hypothetical protein
MNKAIYSMISIGALGVLIMLALNRHDIVASTTVPQGSNPGSNPAETPLHAPLPSSIQNRDDELTVRFEPAVDLKALGIDATPFRGMTSDPALIRILASFRPSQIGVVKQVSTNRVEIEFDGGRRFTAAQIGEGRSKANDGAIALDAITTPDGTPIKSIDANDRGVTAPGNPGEIWVIDASGKTERISPPSVHASRPVISPDGRHVAFTAQFLIGGSLHSKVLMIKDRSTGELSSYAEPKHRADYEIAPVDWVEGGKVLRVIEDWGETGGHMKLKQVRVP